MYIDDRLLDFSSDEMRMWYLRGYQAYVCKIKLDQEPLSASSFENTDAWRCGWLDAQEDDA